MNCMVFQVFQRLRYRFRKGWMRTDYPPHLLSGQPIDDGLCKFADEISRSGTHQLCAKKDIGFASQTTFDKSAVCSFDQRFPFAAIINFPVFTEIPCAFASSAVRPTLAISGSV